SQLNRSHLYCRDERAAVPAPGPHALPAPGGVAERTGRRSPVPAADRHRTNPVPGVAVDRRRRRSPPVATGGRRSPQPDAGRGRVGERVCRFVMDKSALVDAAECTVLDLADPPMPFFAEPLAPLANHDRRPSAAVQAWLAAMAAADAYVFVTPEYNHAPPAA